MKLMKMWKYKMWKYKWKKTKKSDNIQKVKNTKKLSEKNISGKVKWN